MKVVITNAYVRQNAGDAALLSVCLRHVREAFPGADIVITGMEEPSAYPTFESAPNLGSIRRYVADGGIPRWRRLLRKSLGMLLGTGYLALPTTVTRGVVRLLPREVAGDIEALSGADLVVSMGGGYLTARPGLDGYQTVFFALFALLVAQKHQVPVVFAPQSFGPFPGAAQRWLVARAVGRAALVLAREDVSLRVLADCGVAADRIQRGVDSGFAFDPPSSIDWRARLGVDRGTRLVGVTARRWLAPQAQQRYEQAVASTIDTLHAGGARVVLIPQVATDYLGDDDRIVHRRIAGYCTAAPLVIEDGIDYRELKGVYRACDTLIGTRFHSVIFSLTSGTPCVAIEYEHKTRGIMSDLGLESWVIPIAEVTAERLDGLVRRLTEEQDAYRAVLRGRLPGYLADAERLPDLLRQAVPDPAVYAGEVPWRSAATASRNAENAGLAPPSARRSP